jgi:hypothetical protein
MRRKISIKIGEEEFFADLLEDKAPKTIDATLRKLPIEGTCWHSAWFGDAIVLTPNEIPDIKRPTLEPENQVALAGRGDILWYPGQPSIGIPYGESELFVVYGVAELRYRAGYTPANLWARISSRLDELDELGMKMWKGGGARKMIISASD